MHLLMELYTMIGGLTLCSGGVYSWNKRGTGACDDD